MAVCVIGGLVTSTVLTLIVVPVAYSASERMVTSGPVRWVQRRLMGGSKREIAPRTARSVEG
jgi:HAE1 family hydrophobic/amphiphilic exporter-1